jgi:cytosine/adenosine deaminase-related metal-dependent hydrolase
MTIDERLLLRGGHVVTMDPRLGELPQGDVLIAGERIEAVGERIAPEGAEVLDLADHVVLPGFVDTHRHTWQTPFRGLCADWTLTDYSLGVRLGISPRLAAEDVYAGNHLGALEALDAGVTTILDFSHSVNTPEHGEAAVEGLRDAGIRATFAYGYFGAPASDAGFARFGDRVEDARRLRAARLADDRGLVTMGIALNECGLVPFEQTMAEIDSARELGIPIVMHTGCNWGSAITEGIAELDHHGLLGPDQVHVHCNTLDERDLTRLASHDCKISASPETELQMGMGHPVIGRALELGMRPSLSCDIVSASSGDMFAQMRIGLQFERCMRNDAFNSRNRMPDQLTPTVRDALGWGTANGAHAMGLEGRIGSLTPGKQADVAVIGGRSLSLSPMADPVGCLISQANPADVRHVLVAGRFVKRDGELVGVDVDRARSLAEKTRDRVLASANADGPLPPRSTPELEDLLTETAAANLARAWAIEPRQPSGRPVDGWPRIQPA